MRADWVAGSVRARLLVAERTLGPEGVRELAEAASIQDALIVLARSPYRRDVELRADLAEAQRLVVATTLLHLRVLAGWLPREGAALLRALAAWFELVNLEDRVAYLAGGRLRQPFELGSLAVAWPRASSAQTLEELRRTLATSAWGDPGGLTPAEVGLGLRLAWARRVVSEVPEAKAWAEGAVALLLARELFVVGRPVELVPVPSLPALGRAWQSAATFLEFAEALPGEASWALEGADSPEGLWRAEARWWDVVEREAASRMHAGFIGRPVVVAAAALLAADARRTVGALEAAVRSGLPGVAEVLDATR